MPACRHCSKPFVRIPGDREQFCSRDCYFENKRVQSVATASSRFAANCIRVESGCIEWTARKAGNGYGSFSIRNRSVYAHRFAYEMQHGPIPPGQCVLHRCDNPPCVNHEHLFLGSMLDNSRDSRSKNRVHLGSARSGARLSRDDVVAIRAAHLKGVTFKALGAQFGISAQHAFKVFHGKKWGHLHASTAASM